MGTEIGTQGLMISPLSYSPCPLCCGYFFKYGFTFVQVCLNGNFPTYASHVVVITDVEYHTKLT
jgi:hypothetical protein